MHVASFKFQGGKKLLQILYTIYWDAQRCNDEIFDFEIFINFMKFLVNFVNICISDVVSVSEPILSLRICSSTANIQS